MLKEYNFSLKNGFYIWFDKKYKKEYYISTITMCKTKFVKPKDNKFNTIKLIENYSNKFNEKKDVYYSTADILNPFEENYGIFLINFLNADFSTFESSYLTFFCFYGMALLEEYSNSSVAAQSFKSENDFKSAYESIFYKSQKKLKELQSNIRLCVNYTYNLKGYNEYPNQSYLQRFISYSISKNLFKYTTNINMYFNINYAYNINEISSSSITPLKVKEKIGNRIINPTESNIYNSNYISNIIYLCLNEIATNQAVSVGICKNCGKYFISYQKSPEKYCRITYYENEKICKDIGIQIAYKKKQANNECLKLYRNTYQKKLMYAKRSNDEKIKEDFNNWKLLAKEKVAFFNKGIISSNELIEWLEAH